MAGLISQAGSSIIFQAGQWIAALPKAQQKLVFADDPELVGRWDEVHGDRQTEDRFHRT